MRSGVPNEKEWWNTKEVADYLGLERITVHRWCRSGYLKGLKVGKCWRIHRQALEDLLKRSETYSSSSSANKE
jgi:excisionase family DNA binding protein